MTIQAFAQRACGLFVLLFIAGVGGAGQPTRVSALSGFQVTKILCYATGCPSSPFGETSVTALTPVFYQITIGNPNVN